MNFTTLVDVAIGLTLVYLGASLLVTVANEYIAQLLRMRARQLSADLLKLIDSTEFRDKLLSNPALAGFFGKASGGTYVDPKVVAQQLVGGIDALKNGVVQMQDIVSSLEALPDSALKRNLLAIAKVSSTSVERYVADVGVWVDQSLTMLGEQYKKNAQKLSLVVGLLLAAAFNLDTIAITKQLYRDKETREAMVVLASDVVQRSSKETLEKCSKLKPDEMAADAGCAGVKDLIDGVRKRNEVFGKLPIGWPPEVVEALPTLPAVTLTMGVGWLLTALAISLGASFWFDLLAKLVNVRHGMRKPVPAADAEAAGKATP